MPKFSRIGLLASCSLIALLYGITIIPVYSQENKNAGEAEFNPLAVSPNDRLIVVNDFQEFISKVRHCDELKDTVVMYNGEKADGPIWIRASKTMFCKAALNPRRQHKLAICDFSKEVSEQLIVANNINQFASFDPKKDNVSKIIPIVKPILDCFKNSSNYESMSSAELMRIQNDSTKDEKSTTKPANESYSDLLK